MTTFNDWLCAIIVYVTYTPLGYYEKTWSDFCQSIRDYLAERRKLKSSMVLTETILGFPVGTLMASKDEGWLPVDLLFRKKMRKLRSQHRKGSIGYIGKFGVLPLAREFLITLKLWRRVVIWANEERVTTIVMVVNPRRVKKYEWLGAKAIAMCPATLGLKRAPGVLMMLDLTTSKVIQSRLERIYRVVTQPNQKTKGAA